MGSKARISKYILPIILKDRKENQFYVEPFVGGANLIMNVDSKDYCIGADNNKYLIVMWKFIQNGWTPPCTITRELYNECREKYNKSIIKDYEEMALIGYVGFNGSYGGRFYDGGYAGIVTTKQGKERNYPHEAYSNVMTQKMEILDMEFIYSDYRDLKIPNNSIIYCDIPYKSTKKYNTAKDFDYNIFYNWCREKVENGHIVFVSEYEMPNDFICVWEKEVSSSLRANGIIKGDKKSVEKLFKLCKGVNNDK